MRFRIIPSSIVGFSVVVTAGKWRLSHSGTTESKSKVCSSLDYEMTRSWAASLHKAHVYFRFTFALRVKPVGISARGAVVCVHLHGAQIPTSASLPCEEVAPTSDLLHSCSFQIGDILRVNSGLNTRLASWRFPVVSDFRFFAAIGVDPGASHVPLGLCPWAAPPVLLS